MKISKAEKPIVAHKLGISSDFSDAEFSKAIVESFGNEEPIANTGDDSYDPSWLSKRSVRCSSAHGSLNRRGRLVMRVIVDDHERPTVNRSARPAGRSHRRADRQHGDRPDAFARAYVRRARRHERDFGPANGLRR